MRRRSSCLRKNAAVATATAANAVHNDDSDNDDITVKKNAHSSNGEDSVDHPQHNSNNDGCDGDDHVEDNIHGKCESEKASIFDTSSPPPPPPSAIVHEDMHRVCTDWSVLFRNSQSFGASAQSFDYFIKYGYDIDEYESDVADGIIHDVKHSQVDHESNEASARIRNGTTMSFETLFPQGAWEVGACIAWLYNVLTLNLYLILSCLTLWIVLSGEEVSAAAPHTSTEASAVVLSDSVHYIVLASLLVLSVMQALNVTNIGNRFMRSVYRDGYLRRRNPGYCMRTLLKSLLSTFIACAVLDNMSFVDHAHLFLFLALYVLCVAHFIPERERNVLQWMHASLSPYAHLWLARAGTVMQLPYPRFYVDGSITSTLAGTYVYSPNCLVHRASYFLVAFARTFLHGARITGASPNAIVDASHTTTLSNMQRSRIPRAYVENYLPRVHDLLLGEKGLKFVATILCISYVIPMSIIVASKIMEVTDSAAAAATTGDSYTIAISICMCALASVLTPICMVLPKSAVSREATFEPTTRYIVCNVICAEVFVDACVVLSLVALSLRVMYPTMTAATI